MRRLLFLVFVVLITESALASAADSLRAYRVPDSSIAVDGLADPAWQAIAAAGGEVRLDLRDYRDIVVLWTRERQNADPETLGLKPYRGTLGVSAAYDRSYLYFLFSVRLDSAAPVNGMSCPQYELWKLDAVQLYLDPHAWTVDLTGLAGIFQKDSISAFGTSDHSIAFYKPTSIADGRYAYHDRTLDNIFAFDKSSLIRSSIRFPGFRQASSAAAGPGTRYLWEIRLPYNRFDSAHAWAELRPGQSLFINWGFIDSQGSLDSVCSNEVILHTPMKKYRSFTSPEWRALTGSLKGWAPDDSVHYDPSHSFLGWGKLTLSDSLVQPPAGSACPPGILCGGGDAVKPREASPLRIIPERRYDPEGRRLAPGATGVRLPPPR